MDNSLRFDEHVSNICFKSKQEVKWFNECS